MWQLNWWIGYENAWQDQITPSPEQGSGNAVGLTNNSFGASLAWREALGSSDNLSTRLVEARALLDRPGISLDEPTQAFVSSPEGLSLVVEARSSIRLRGDRVAHPVTIARTHFDGPILRNPFPSETPGLQALVDFVCTQYVPSSGSCLL